MVQIGFGSADITPEAGAEMPGGFGKALGKGVRDKLYAVACVVHSGDNPVALVGIDALMVGQPTVDAARRMIQKTTKIPADNILIGASHTHLGGPIISCFSSEGDPKYIEKVVEAIHSAVGSAWNSLHAGEIGIGVGTEGTISFNRRYLMRDGREITHPGKPGTKFNQDIISPAGPIDPDVGVLAVRAGKDKIAGIVVNFACHNTVVGGNQFSADYVGFLRKHLQAHYGETTPVVFLLGPCGDITQVDNQSTAREFGAEHANMMGMKLAAATIRTIDRMTWLTEAPTAAALETVQLAIRPEPDADAERPPYGLGSDGSQAVSEVYAKERQKVAELRKKTPKITTEVQAIRIGPLGIASTGAEYFCEYGLRIKKASRMKSTWVVSLANDYIGYVTTAQAFVSGGYEPRTATSSKLALESGQRIVETALKALDKVTPKDSK
jgi:neutral ceramidase